MREYVTDTHPLIWYLAGDKQLSRAAKQIFAEAEEGHAVILVPSIVLVESVFLLQRQRVSTPLLDQVLSMTEDVSGIRIVPLDATIASRVADFGPSAITEMPDRIIAAPARALGLPLISADEEIAASELVQVIW